MRNNKIKLPKEYYLEEVSKYSMRDIRYDIEASLIIYTDKVIAPERIARFNNNEHQQVFNDIYHFVVDMDSKDMVNDILYLMDESGFFG